MKTQEDCEYDFEHEVLIESLDPGKRYVFRVYSRDDTGKDMVSGDYIFRKP